MQPYKFINHTDKTCAEIMAENQNSAIHKAYEFQKKSSLTRAEKNEIARLCYGLSSPHSSTCKLMGVAYPFSDSLHVKRILVRFDYDSTFTQYFAPDKTSLRKAIHDSHRIAEMIYA